MLLQGVGSLVEALHWDNAATGDIHFVLAVLRQSLHSRRMLKYLLFYISWLWQASFCCHTVLVTLSLCLVLSLLHNNDILPDFTSWRANKQSWQDSQHFQAGLSFLSSLNHHVVSPSLFYISWLWQASFCCHSVLVTLSLCLVLSLLRNKDILPDFTCWRADKQSWQDSYKII